MTHYTQYDLLERIKALEAKLSNLLIPAFQTSQTNESSANALAQFYTQSIGNLSNTTIFQNYGYWSAPLQNSTHIVMNMGGVPGNWRKASIASTDESVRPKNMSAGDVCVKDFAGQTVFLHGGTTITISANNTITINAPSGCTINASGGCTINASSGLTVNGNTQINGTLNVTGDIQSTNSGISLVNHVHTVPNVQNGGGSATTNTPYG